MTSTATKWCTEYAPAYGEDRAGERVRRRAQWYSGHATRARGHGHQQQLVEVPALQSLSLRGGTVVSPAQHQFVGSPEVVLVPHPQPLRTAPVQVKHVHRAENAERCSVAILPVVLARGGGCGHFIARDCAGKKWGLSDEQSFQPHVGDWATM